MTLIFILLLVILGALWFIDEVLTILDVRRFGIYREENALVRKLLKKGNTYFTVFKVFSFVGFVTTIMFIRAIHYKTSIVLTSLALLSYLIVVVRNFEIYEHEKF